MSFTDLNEKWPPCSLTPIVFWQDIIYAGRYMEFMIRKYKEENYCAVVFLDDGYLYEYRNTKFFDTLDEAKLDILASIESFFGSGQF